MICCRRSPMMGYAERGLFDNLAPARDNAFFYSMGKTLMGIQIDTVYE